jgi:hypothetical protein
MAGYESVRAEVEVLLRHYAFGLDMPAHARAYAAAIAPAAWDAFPKGGTLHDHAVFAEVISFHALKAAGLPVDQVRFRAASVVGGMPMNARHWLLRYQRHLPPALRVAGRDPSPEAWLSRIPPGPVVDAARVIMATEAPRLASMRPRTRAGVAVVTAWKRSGLARSGDASLSAMLAAAGIYLSSAYNAAVRAGLITDRTRTRAGADVAATA